MALTVRKIISDIRNIATSGSNPIDFRIEDSQILFWVNETRSMLISQAVKKREDINDSWLQQITCLPLISVDKSQCCEITTDCNILRAEVALPDTVDTSSDNFIVRVETDNGTIISKTTPFESKYNSYGKYGSNKPKWYLKNNYLYIINEEVINSINVTAVFEAPEELASYVSCSGSACFSYDSEYPATLRMANDITNIVLKTKVFPFYQMPRDTSNNASDNFDAQPNLK